MILNATKLPISTPKGKRTQSNGLHSFLAYAYSKTKSNICRLELVESATQYRELMRLRLQVFIKGNIYPFKYILNSLERQSVHILAKQEKKYVGMISIKLDDDYGLPLEHYFKLDSYKKRNRKIAEFGKFGVLAEAASDKMVFYQLIAAAYAFTRFCGYDTIVMTTLKRLERNNRIYTKMGFQIIADVEIYNGQPAYVMMLDLNSVNGLMWTSTQLTKVAKRLIQSINPPVNQK